MMQAAAGETDVYTCILAGKEVNFEKLKADPLKGGQEEMTRITGRTDIRITKVRWQGDWR